MANKNILAFCFVFALSILSCFAVESAISASSNLSSKAPLDLSVENSSSLSPDDSGKENEKLSLTRSDEKLKNEKESVQSTFIDSVVDILSFLDIFNDLYANIFEQEENDDDDIDGKTNKDVKYDDIADSEETESLFNDFFGILSPSSSSSFFSSLFPFSFSPASEDDEFFPSPYSFSSSSLANMTNYIMNVFNFESLPYFFDAMFSPLVGMMYRPDDMNSRITTIVDENEKICRVNVDMQNLPSTAIMQVEVENDGTVMIYFSNGQVISMYGEKIPSETVSSSHTYLRGDEQRNKNGNDTDSTSVSVNTPDTVSTVYSTSTFLLDKKCNASSDDGKATIDNEILIMKFPLKKCAYINNGDNCTQEPEEENDVSEKSKNDYEQKRNQNYNDEFYKEYVFYNKNNNNYDDNKKNKTELGLTQDFEDDEYRNNMEDLIIKREELTKAGPISDPLYMNEQKNEKKKHIVPLFKVEKF